MPTPAVSKTEFTPLAAEVSVDAVAPPAPTVIAYVEAEGSANPVAVRYHPPPPPPP